MLHDRLAPQTSEGRVAVGTGFRGNGPKPKWTDELSGELTRLWREGLSAREIAEIIPGGFSRNAVLGRLHRLGLIGLRRVRRAPAPRKSRARARPQAPSVGEVPDASDDSPGPATNPPVWPRVVPPPPEPPSQPHEGLLRLDQLTGRSCRWPIGDPLAADFGFCGATTVPGRSYCAAHEARATTPIRPR